MAEWSTLTGIDLTKVEEAAEGVQDLQTAVAGYLQAVASALRVLALFVTPGQDVIKSLIDATLDLVEAMILDLMQNNVALALHINVVWDHEWVWDYYHLPHNERGGVPNWTEGQNLPYKANGVDGWLLDIAASAKNKGDPFRPLTDSDTTVMGFIILVGRPSFDDLADVLQILEAFSDWSHLDYIGNQEALDAEASKQALMRAKQALFSNEIGDRIYDPEAIAEDLREAQENFNEDWSFRPNSFPKWASVPIARIFPPVHELFLRLQAVADALRMPSNSPLAELAELLAKKAELLAELARELGDIIQNLLALASILEGAHVISLQVGPWEGGAPDSAVGGMDAFIAEALAASDKPDFGDSGIVGGLVGVVTADDPASHLEAFLQLVGIEMSEYSEGQTTRANQISDTLEDASSYF